MKTLKNVLKKTVFLFILLSLTFSCKKDDDLQNEIATIPIEIPESNDEENNRISSVISQGIVTRNVLIKVVNTSGVLQPGVTLSYGNAEEMTDEKGYAIFEKIEVNADYILLKASKPGYEEALKTVATSDNGLTYTEIMLVKDVPELDLEASVGGKLIKDNITLNFPPESIIDQNGKLFKGTAKVNIIYYGLENPNFERIQPGILTGITEDNQEVGLISEGMITVDIMDTKGNPLNIGNNKKVKITMPASNSSDEKIDLWHLNETYGLWVESSVAIKNNNLYEFEVSHFSSYNLDYKTPNAFDFTVRFLDGANRWLPFIPITMRYEIDGRKLKEEVVTNFIGEVKITNALPSLYEFTYISDNGLCGDIKKEVTVEKTIISPGQYTIKDPTPTVDNKNKFSIKGVLLDCINRPLKNKYFEIEIEGIDNVYRRETDEFGNYEIFYASCDILDGLKTAKLKLIDPEGAGTIRKEFIVDISKSNLITNLTICEPITSFEDNDRLNFPFCLNNHVLSITNLPRSQELTYGDVKNIKNLGDSCKNNLLRCSFDFSLLYYFTSIEKIAISLDSRNTDFDKKLEILQNLKTLKSISLVSYSGTPNIDETRRLVSQALPNVIVTNEDCGILIL